MTASPDPNRPALRTGGQLVAEAIVGAGIRTVFGVPGESYMGLLDALYDSPVRFISTRHEGGGAFMASGYSKTSGEIGVCMGTRAVGTANMVIGIHNARQDSTPMIAIAGQVEREYQLREAFQEVDLVAMMTPVCKWAVQVPDAERAPELMARAVQVATSGRPGPVFVALPHDVCTETADPSAVVLPSVTVPHPDPSAAAIVRDALLGAQAPLIFAGGGVANRPGGVAALVAAAEALEVPVITSWRRHDGFPNDHRLFLGSASLGAAPAVWDRVAGADVILVIGNRLQENTTRGYTLPTRDAQVFVVDIDSAYRPGHVDPRLTVNSDGPAFLRALTESTLSDAAPAAAREEQRRRNDGDRAAFEKVTELTLPPTGEPGSGVNHAHVVHALRKVLPADGIIATDAGNFSGWLVRHFPYLRPGTYVGPVSGAMGYGLPAAIGAKLGRPESAVVSVSGDGGFMMTIAELETAVRYGVGVVAVVLDNERHGTIRMHQERDHPGRVMGTDLGTPDLAAVARAFGAQGWSVTENDQVEPALRAALAAGGPALVHVKTAAEELSVDSRLPVTSPPR